MLKNIIRKVLNKYNVDNVAELKGVFFNKMRNDDIPDPDVIDINNKTEFNPRQLEFQDILEKNRIADFLGIEWFDEETNIYQTERAHGFIFNCGTLVGCSSDLDDQLKGLFNLGIPDYTGMQILLIASSELEDKFNSYESIHHSPLLQKVAQERIKFYRQGLKESLRPGYKLPVRDFKLVITFTFDGLYDENNYAAMTSLQQSISSVLKSCYVANQMMKPDGLINLLREILCTSMNPVEKHNYNPNLPIKEQIAEIDNNIYIAADGLCINDIGVKSIAVGEYPKDFRIQNCAKFIGDPFAAASQISYPFIMCQNITFLNSTKENAKMQAAAMKTAEQIKPGKFTRLFPIFHKKHAEYQLMQSLISNGEGFMLMNHTIHVFYPLGKSESAFQEVKSLFKTFGWHMVPNTNLQLPAFLCSLPLFHDLSTTIAQRKAHMMALYTQTNVVNMMPLFGDYKGTGNPILMLLSPCGQIMFFDIFQSNTNYNVAISASSGAGKSFFTNEIVKSYRATGSKVSVIDVGRSYKDTCSVLDGQYIEFTREAAICINPFSFIKLKLDDNAEYDLTNITKEQLLSLEDLDDQITMLKAIFLVSAGISEDDARYQLADSLFEQAIISSLQTNQTNSTYTTVYDKLIESSDETGLAKLLAESIKSYTAHGIFGRYFEGNANLDINNDFMVLELEELQGKGSLKFVVLLILMLKITQDMYLSERSQRKICIIDEAWDLMAGGNTGKFIVTGYRRARKYNGSFMTITQRIDDYAANATTAACYDNAAIKIMLMQGLPKTIELDDYTKKMLQSLKSEAGVYSELIIDIADSGIKAKCRFIVDDYTQMLYSTKAEDITLLKQIKDAENLDTPIALERLISIRNQYINQYKRPRHLVTNELLSYISTEGYTSLINLLNTGAQNE